MQKHQPLQDKIQQILPMAAFNRWLDLQLVSAAPGEVTLHVPWRDEFGQYSGFLHAGILGALIDTACGFAAITQTDRVLASQYTVRCLRPAVAETFVVRGWVVKPGRQQVSYTPLPSPRDLTGCRMPPSACKQNTPYS